MYKNFIHIFVLSCTKATCLIEKRLHTKLNLIERLQLYVHLSLCSHCLDYDKKAALLDKLTKASIRENERAAIFTPSEIDHFKIKVFNRIKS